MKMMRVFLICFLCCFCVYGVWYVWFSAVSGPFTVKGGDVVYEGYRGYLVEPDARKSAYPGVVMIHEWWGLNDYIKDMAHVLAREGYRVLAVDLFGTVATTTEQARAQVAALDIKKTQDNLSAAVTYLRASGSLKVASLGWRFGGGQSFNLAVSGVPVDATIIYYGTVVPHIDMLSKIRAPILGIFGELDGVISTTTVRAYHNALVSLNKPRKTIMYPGVGNTFANSSSSDFAQKEATHAWGVTLNFLDHYLRGGPDVALLMPLE